MKKKISGLLKIKYVLMILTILLLGSIVVNFSMGGDMQSYGNRVFSLFTPLRNAAASVNDYFQGLSEEKKNSDDLQEKIDALTTENETLRLQLEKYQTDIYELKELRELLNIKEQYSDYNTVVCSVISKNAGNWFYEFTINKGTDDGIEKDMNVLANGGLAGIVTSVGKNYAVVTSILADDMNVSAISSTTRDTCIVSGDLNLLEKGVVRVMYVHSDAKIKDYDRIITSSTSSKYLPHVLIGYVYGLENDSNELTKSGYLVPAVDFEHLENVIVILDKKEIPED